MTDPKSILDTVADETNKLFEHAAQQIKEGKHTAAHETLAIAERMSGHVREIEDHERIMDERHNISVVVPGGSDIQAAARALSDERARS